MKEEEVEEEVGEKVEETAEEESEEPEPEPEEGECECYSVDPPGQPWRSTFAFGTYQCKLCGRRRKK